MLDYIKGYEEIEDIVLERMSHYKRKLIPGTDDYELIYKRLYETEQKNRVCFNNAKHLYIFRKWSLL